MIPLLYFGRTASNFLYFYQVRNIRSFTCSWDLAQGKSYSLIKGTSDQFRFCLHIVLRVGLMIKIKQRVGKKPNLELVIYPVNWTEQITALMNNPECKFRKSNTRKLIKRWRNNRWNWEFRARIPTRMDSIFLVDPTI